VAPPLADATLRNPATLWEAVQRTAGDYICVVDRSYVIRDVNRVDQGFTADQVVGRRVLDFTIDDSTDRLRAAIDEVFRTAGTAALRTRVRTPTGAVRDFSVRLGPVLHENHVAAVIVCSEDITPLEESERALSRERSVLRRLLDIQEQERLLVSYEIHDGLAQYLAGAIMHLEAHLHALGGHEPRELVDSVRLVRAAAEESRRLIAGLRPPALDELGIVDAIESLVADARIEIPRVDFRHELPGEPAPPRSPSSACRKE